MNDWIMFAVAFLVGACVLPFIVYMIQRSNIRRENEQLEGLLGKLVELVDSKGPYSDEVIKLVRDNKDVAEFVDLAAVYILMTTLGINMSKDFRSNEP